MLTITQLSKRRIKVYIKCRSKILRKFYGIDIRILHNFTARNFNFYDKTDIKLSIKDTTRKIM